MGRNFSRRGFAGSDPVAIINQSLAHLLWGKQNALGRCLYVSRDRRCRRVVGVVGDNHINRSIFAAAGLQCYLPIRQYASLGFSRAGDYLFVRTAPGAVEPVIQQLKRTPGVGSYVYATEVKALVNQDLRTINMGLAILGPLALAAAAVSAVGIFAQLAFWVRSRRRELGIRLALGAPASSMIQTVASRSALAVGLGLRFGLLASVPISKLARSYFFGLVPLPLTSLVSTALIVLTAAALACTLTCIRALKLDPMETISTE